MGSCYSLGDHKLTFLATPSRPSRPDRQQRQVSTLDYAKASTPINRQKWLKNGDLAENKIR